MTTDKELASTMVNALTTDLRRINEMTASQQERFRKRVKFVAVLVGVSFTRVLNKVESV